MAYSEQIKTQGIDIVNEQGVAQVRIAAKLPNPVVGGVEMKREVAVGGNSSHSPQTSYIPAAQTSCIALPWIIPILNYFTTPVAVTLSVSRLY